jgi:hypothetical protein
LAHEGDEVVSAATAAFTPQETFLVLIPARGFVDPRKDYVNEKFQ